MTITPTQCRMARAGLNWTIDELAAAAGLAPNTVNSFEKGQSVRDITLSQIIDALVTNGALFEQRKGHILVGMPAPSGEGA